MICNVVLSKDKDKYIAQVKDWPEIMVEETSRDKAINSIKSKLLDYLTSQVELVQIDVPLPSHTGNPWLDKFGWFKDDPTFDDLKTEIASYRKEIDCRRERRSRKDYCYICLRKDNKEVA